MAKMCIETDEALIAGGLTSGSVTQATGWLLCSATVAAKRLGVRAAPLVVRLKYEVVATTVSPSTAVEAIQF
jgi:hypothetical protein